MQKYKEIPGLYAGIILWFVEHDKVFYIPIQTVIHMSEDGKKSINIKDVDSYTMYELQSKKKRTFLETDYSKLLLMTN